jgi:hypothetical protein
MGKTINSFYKKVRDEFEVNEVIPKREEPVFVHVHPHLLLLKYEQQN